MKNLDYINGFYVILILIYNYKLVTLIHSYTVLFTFDLHVDHLKKIMIK